MKSLIVTKEWTWCRLGQTGYTQTGVLLQQKIRIILGISFPLLDQHIFQNQMMKYLKKESELGFVNWKANFTELLNDGLYIGETLANNINEIDVTCNQQINI
jgi:hypothetical protein